MKQCKKALSLLLVMVLILSPFSLSAKAMDENDVEPIIQGYAIIGNDGELSFALDVSDLENEECIEYSLDLYASPDGNENARIWMNIGTVSVSVYTNYWTYVIYPNWDVILPVGRVEYRCINTSGMYQGNYSAYGLANICSKSSNTKFISATFYLTSVNYGAASVFKSIVC